MAQTESRLITAPLSEGTTNITNQFELVSILGNRVNLSDVYCYSCGANENAGATRQVIPASRAWIGQAQIGQSDHTHYTWITDTGVIIWVPNLVLPQQVVIGGENHWALTDYHFRRILGDQITGDTGHRCNAIIRMQDIPQIEPLPERLLRYYNRFLSVMELISDYVHIVPRQLCIEDPDINSTKYLIGTYGFYMRR